MDLGGSLFYSLKFFRALRKITRMIDFSHVCSRRFWERRKEIDPKALEFNVVCLNSLFTMYCLLGNLIEVRPNICELGALNYGGCSRSLPELLSLESSTPKVCLLSMVCRASIMTTSESFQHET